MEDRMRLTGACALGMSGSWQKIAKGHVSLGIAMQNTVSIPCREGKLVTASSEPFAPRDWLQRFPQAVLSVMNSGMRVGSDSDGACSFPPAMRRGYLCPLPNPVFEDIYFDYFDMAADHFHHHDGSADPYLIAGDINLYDTSSESSASSPLNSNTFEHVYGGNDHVYGGNTFMTYPPFPMQYQANGVPVGLIPVELDIEGIYDDHDRRRRKSGNDKAAASHVHSRRRAQNRASQRAFRDRKEKHMRELEQRLEELEGRHNDLSRSYESLQVEYAGVKQELDRLRKEKGHPERPGSGSPRDFEGSNGKVWDESRVESVDPLLFDVSAFCFDQEEGGPSKE
ncbi:hypothetical protein NHQ30_007245 [Ciborinia camelliae]|nr:hypothetical protein NHQ30_007245 [Ciborinia camelliae]